MLRCPQGNIKTVTALSAVLGGSSCGSPDHAVPKLPGPKPYDSQDMFNAYSRLVWRFEECVSACTRSSETPYYDTGYS